MSFPAAVTNIKVGIMTDEYRLFTAEGYIRGKEALHPVPSCLLRTPTVLAHTEKVMKLKDMMIVTWKEDDPKDPRNLINAYRWYIAALAAMSVILVAFSSAVVAGNFYDLQEEFHVSSHSQYPSWLSNLETQLREVRASGPHVDVITALRCDYGKLGAFRPFHPPSRAEIPSIKPERTHKRVCTVHGASPDIWT
ncbi:hypothetical protein PUNSTDRAFT_132837 [Punctularia strigosozonata HHB-11173 SS5]|uniref:uncharacterized protein n=1 Tax=Punctularia strigosozonata (strain HHB-11173) TaxID=741275 RepID=UPI0004417B4E|nr:uncharacterized protein PUNSTDRAFT_132837 [Punctularia strigosozonata HHB-11173 SS5]EIN10762.1 hypothetical protein PUNSTDRAFT_132837 [Punctularia strigosozonata HHB-11173 SS5]